MSHAIIGTAPALRGGASSGTAPALRGGASICKTALLGAVAIIFTACSKAPEKPAANSAAQAEAGKADGPCAEYARRLCTELGTRTEACRSTLGVVALMSPRACSAGLEDFDSTHERIADLRKACETVADNVCNALGADSESCQAIRQNLPDIPPGHCLALLHDQDQLVAALRQREAMSGPLSDERWRALISGTAPSFGAADARVVVVEFTDFECPFCAQAAETVRRLKQDYATRIRVIVRQFPLSIHPDARNAAQAALAAHDQGKFWEYHDLLFSHQDALGRDALVGYAQKLGLNAAAFQTAIGSESVVQRVAEDMRLGESVQVQGTPTMFVDKKRIDNPIDYDQVASAVDAALEPAQ